MKLSVTAGFNRNVCLWSVSLNRFLSCPQKLKVASRKREFFNDQSKYFFNITARGTVSVPLQHGSDPVLPCAVPLRYRSGAKNAWNALAQVWSAPIEEASRATTKRRDYNVKDVFGEFLLVFAFLEIHYSDRVRTLSKRKRGVGAAHC